MLLNNEWVNNEIKEEIKNFWRQMQMNSHLKHKFIVIQAYLNKTETFQINNLTLHLQELEEQQQTEPRASRRKEITKLRAELNDIETKRTIQRINKSRSWFFEKRSKMNKPSGRLIKRKREKTQLNNIRNETGEITTDTTDIQRIVRNYYEELYVKKFENLGEMDKFLETYNLPKLNEKTESLNKLTFGEIEAVIKKFLAHRSPGVDGFTEEFYKAFKEELTPILCRLFQKNSRRGKDS